MNADTGHLIDMEKFKSALGEGTDLEKDMRSLKERGYEEVPNEMATAAKKKLAGKSEAHVSLTSGGKLSKWAAQKRKAKKQRESRKRNRK